MNEPGLKIRTRNLPHWTLDGSTYFITFRVIQGILTEDERQITMDHIKSGHGRFYNLAAVVVMPDHVHLLLRPLGEYDLSRIMKGIKGASSRKINRHRQTMGTVWQDESCDRIMRDYAEFQEKLNYMGNNPIKAGLVRTIEEYAYWHCNGSEI